METALSIYFSADKTYVALVGFSNSYLELLYVNSTEHTAALDDPEDEGTYYVAMELESILKEITIEVTRVSITLPAEDLLFSLFPGTRSMKKADILQLVNLEIRQQFPQLNMESFTASAVPLIPWKNGNDMMMSVIIPKQNYETAKTLLASLGKPVNNIEISQLNAHNAFNFNYPEYKNKTVALFGVSQQFVDISLIFNGMPVFYNLASMNDSEQFAKICQDEIKQLLAQKVPKIDAAFFFGTGLTKELMDSARSALGDQLKEVSRLNAFRMMKTNLSQRHKDYCSMTRHIFPPCIGGCLNPYHERFKIL